MWAMSTSAKSLVPICAVVAAAMQFGMKAPARACSGPPAFFRESRIADGQEIVPTNARIHVFYGGCDSDADVPNDVRLEKDGAVVAGAWSQVEPPYWQFVPLESLNPQTEYTISDRFGSCVGDKCVRGEWKAWSSFKTGPGVDTTPPHIAAPVNFNCMREVCDPGKGCLCGSSWDYWSLNITVSNLEADTRIYAVASAPDWGPHRGIHLSPPVSEGLRRLRLRPVGGFRLRWSLAIWPTTASRSNRNSLFSPRMRVARSSRRPPMGEPSLTPQSPLHLTEEPTMRHHLEMAQPPTRILRLKESSKFGEAGAPSRGAPDGQLALVCLFSFS
jgi:hypothetical protein